MQRLLSHPLVIAIFTALAIVFFVSLDKNAQTAKTSSETLQALKSQNKELEQDVKNLEEQVQTAQSEISKEKIIRNELLLQKPGEYVVQLPGDALKEDAGIEPVPPETPWEAWKKVLL